MRDQDQSQKSRGACARLLSLAIAGVMLSAVACGGQEANFNGNQPPPVENRWDAMGWDQGEWASRPAHDDPRLV